MMRSLVAVLFFVATQILLGLPILFHHLFHLSPEMILEITVALEGFPPRLRLSSDSVRELAQR